MSSPLIVRSFRLTAGLCLAAASLLHADPVAVGGAPQGVMAAQLPIGKHPLAIPLLGQELWVGVIAGNVADTITVGGAPVAPQLVAGGQYYLEVLNGPLEGERFDLNTAATLVAGGTTVKVNLASDSFSTSTTLASDTLANARAAVRRHVTLQSLQAMFSPALVGNNSAALADSVLILRAGILYNYYLRTDGSWRESGKTVDERSKVIPPDSSLLLQLRSGTKHWVQAGDVRTNAFRIRLAAGARAVASGYPVGVSPAEFGAYVDSGTPAANRWKGSDAAASADGIEVFDPATGAFRSYYLRADGASWYPAGGSGDQALAPLFGPTGMVVLKRINADPNYVVVPSFTF